MRTSARVKWRFRRSAAVVSLRDDPKFGDSVVFRSRASPRDAIPSALRLPRRCAPRNDTKLGRLYLGNGRFCFMRPFRAETLRTVFQTFRSEIRFVRKAARRMQLPGKRSRTKKIGCPEKKYAAREAEEASRYIGFFEFFILYCMRYSFQNITVRFDKKIEICLYILRIDVKEKRKYTEISKPIYCISHE